MNNNFDQQSYDVPNYAAFDANGQNIAKKNPFAITSLVLGILSILSCCCCCASVLFVPLMGILGIGAIVFAIVAKVKSKKFDGMSIAGLILGILSIVIFAIMIAMILFVASIPLEEIERILTEAFGEEAAAELMKELESGR